MMRRDLHSKNLAPGRSRLYTATSSWCHIYATHSAARQTTIPTIRIKISHAAQTQCRLACLP
eukprot:6108639-Pyramimonas_sp.AAC.1